VLELLSDLIANHAPVVIPLLALAAIAGLIAIVRMRDHLRESRIRDRRSTLLYDFSQRLTLAVGSAELARTVAASVEDSFGRAALVLLRGADGRLEPVPRPGAAHALTAAELAAAAHALEADEPVSAGSGDLALGSPWTFLPISLPESAVTSASIHDRALGVLAVHQGERRGRRAQEEARLLFAIRDQAALALERIRLVESQQHDRLLAETERLSSAMLASVSHDLRTPLASIMGGASSLLELGGSLDEAARRELLESVLSETERLDRFVQNLLDMTRLGHGALVPQRQWSDLRDMIGGAQRVLRRGLADREVVVEVAPGFPLLHVDPFLLEHVLINLLDNARKFSPPGSPLRIVAGADGQRCRIAVEDHGPGIPAADRDRVFDMFTRLDHRDRKVAGTGLGLAICRGFITALGGTITAEEVADGRGARMTISLPQVPMPSLLKREEDAA
jgi:two-component system sensor histidine kinase KdpD